jgi:hypothetical protein
MVGLKERNSFTKDVKIIFLGKYLYELAETEVAFLSISQEDEDKIPSFTEIRDQLTSIISHCKESVW